MLDGPDYAYLNPVLAKLKVGRPQESLFGLEATKLHKLVARASLDVGVSALHVVPYHMRHTGVSHELAAGHRTLAEAKRRGRWAHDRSLKRYAKGGRLAEQMSRLAPAVQARCYTCHARLGGILRARFV